MKIFSFLNKYKYPLIFTLILSILYVALYKIYIPRLNAFGCFDDCNNFMGGYFLLQGKRMFSEIFFNHNPLAMYLSFLIQYLTEPINLYELILRHRQALILFSFIFNIILIFRFGFSALLFAIFYELTKFYLFGDRFLAEGFIVYSLSYLIGIVILKLLNKKIYSFDYIFAGFLAWFTIFMREPYLPLTLILFAFIIVSRKLKKYQVIALFTFIILCLITIFLHDSKEYYFNLVTANVGYNISSEIKNEGLFGNGLGFIYPFNVFFLGQWNHFRHILISLSSLFIISSILLIIKGKWKLVLVSWIILGLANIRYIEPGKIFYASYHMLSYYAAFIFISFLFLQNLIKEYKKISMVLFAFYVLTITYHLLSPASFIQSKPYTYEEHITNYGAELQTGIIINSLSKKEDSLFIDGFNEIVYWETKLRSPYKYSWYTMHMNSFEKYKNERVKMFKNTPPDFYYGSCPKQKDKDKLLPEFIANHYVRLFNDGKPSCLWIKKTKLPEITDNQWERAKETFFTLPDADLTLNN